MHRACQYIDEGDLDDSTVGPEIAGRVAAYRRFLSEMQPEILAVEEKVENEAYQYAGTLDRRCIINRRESIVDIKGPYLHYYLPTSLQTSGYAGCFPGRKLKRYSLHLQDDGGYKLIDREDPEKFPHHRQDWPDFLACLRVAMLKRSMNGC